MHARVINPPDLLPHVTHAIEAAANVPLPQFLARDSLTRRERDVLDQVMIGASNKEASRQLGISPRTVEVHRLQLLRKLAARNTADLVRIVMSELWMSGLVIHGRQDCAGLLCCRMSMLLEDGIPCIDEMSGESPSKLA